MRKTMKAVRLYGPGDLRCEDVPIPEIDSHEVLIGVKAAGVCGSDVPRALKTGAHVSPVILGHEFSGEILEAGNQVYGLAPGDPVTAYPLIPCGECDYCRQNRYNLCDDYGYLGSRQDGAFAEFVRVPERNCIPLPKELSLEAAAMTDPAAIAFHGLSKAEMKPGSVVVILGAGTIGLFALQWAKLQGAGSVIPVDLVKAKLQTAESLGADATIDASRDLVLDSVLRLSGGRGADVVIEASGSAQAQASSVLLAAKGGKIVFLGISHADLRLNEKQMDRLLRYELSVMGAWNSLYLEAAEWENTLQRMADGSIRCGPLVTHRYALNQAAEAFRMMESGLETFGKVLFLPAGS